MSKRTAERIFVRETQMTFSSWRQKPLLTALPKWKDPLRKQVPQSGYRARAHYEHVQATFARPRALLFHLTNNRSGGS